MRVDISLNSKSYNQNRPLAISLSLLPPPLHATKEDRPKNTPKRAINFFHSFSSLRCTQRSFITLNKDIRTGPSKEAHHSLLLLAQNLLTLTRLVRSIRLPEESAFQKFFSYSASLPIIFAINTPTLLSLYKFIITY